MPSILDLLNNLPNFPYYYGGVGNFSQKSIPFGNDQPGGGDSGQPYIKRAIGERWSPSNFDDGTMRLGIIGATNRSLSDVERIGKFFTDLPRGATFLAKQVGLQLSNPKLESRFGDNGPGTTGNFFSDAVSLPSRISADVGTTRVYNLGINTLAQVGVSAFGGHFMRHGLSPIMDDSDKYINIAASNNQINANQISGSTGNRLLRLESQLFDSGNSIISTYSGGPGSVYGIGSTTINRTVHTIGDSDPNQNSELSSFIPIKVSDLAKIGRDGILVINAPNQNNATQPTNAQLTPAGSANANGTNSYDVRTTDFRLIKNALYHSNLPQTDYVKYNLAARIGRGNPGTVGLDRSKYWSPLTGTQDALNKLSLFYASGPPQTDGSIVDLNSGERVTAASVRDMIKFRIESIDNDNPTFSVWMAFRAFINGFSDTFTADWNKYKYTGRGESFYVYDGYVRQIGLGFTIAAQSRQEMKPLYQKLNYLLSNMAPDYNTANKMRGNIIKLTIGDYMYRQPGIINELHVDIDNDAPWEIAIAEPEGGNDDNTMHEVPMILKVSMTFTPIQDFLPRKGASVPFISVRDRKSPSDPLSAPTANDWLADTGYSSNAQDGTKKYIPLDKKITGVRKKSQS